MNKHSLILEAASEGFDQTPEQMLEELMAQEMEEKIEEETPEFDFRLAQVSDIDAIMEINAELEFDQWAREKFEQVFEYNLTTWLVYRRDGKICGYAIYLLCLDEARILNVTISKEYRGQGLGKRLMMHTLNDAYRQDIHYAMLETRVTNFVALNLYNQLGFRILCVRPDYYTDKEVCDAYFMQLHMKK